MGMCLSRPGENHAQFFPNELQNEVHGDDYAPVFPNEFQNEFHGRGNTKSLDELNVLGQSTVDSSSAMIESGKHELTSPQKFQANSENLELDCKENRTCRLRKSKQKIMKRREKLKARSKNSSSSSEKEIFSHGSLKNCTERHINPISVDCENLKAEAGEEDADFDEILFGHKTGEILDFFHEYSSCTPAESPQSRPKLQIYSLLDMKKLKSIKLSQFSKSSRFGSSISDTESPRSKLIELLMKNLSSRSKSKWSADKNLGDMKPSCVYNDKSEGQKDLVQEDKKRKGGKRQCLLSMFNVDRSFTIEGNTETLIFSDHNSTKNEVFSNLMGGSRVDFRIPVKTLSNEFVMFNFCPNEGGGDPAKLEHQLQGVCRRLSRLSLTEEDAAFGSPFSIGRGRRSKGPEISEDVILGRVSAEVFSDSSSDLFELEFLSF